jgi:hypothetical protein
MKLAMPAAVPRHRHFFAYRDNACATTAGGIIFSLRPSPPAVMSTLTPSASIAPTATADHTEIDALVRAFFSVFTNKNGARPDVDAIHRMFIPQGLIIKCNGAEREIYTIQEFIAPRLKLLTGGQLVNFQEQEISARTDIFGGIAQRYCVYEKSGVLDGKAFHAYGVKTLQLIRMEDGWKMVSLVWEDKRDGLVLPELLKG